MTFLHWTTSTYAVDTCNNTPGIHKSSKSEKRCDIISIGTLLTAYFEAGWPFWYGKHVCHLTADDNFQLYVIVTTRNKFNYCFVGYQNSNQNGLPMRGALKEHTDLKSYLNLQVYILCKIAMPSLTEINQRAVSKISSCRVITTSRWGVKQLGNSFASIFLLFSYRSSRGQCS